MLSSVVVSIHLCYNFSTIHIFSSALKLQSRNNTDAEVVLHSSVKSVTMETTWAMLESPSYNYVDTNSEGTLHLQSLPIKYSYNTIRICVPVRGVGYVDSYELYHSIN